MTYEQFKAAYIEAFKAMTSYRLDQAGSDYYSNKLADLSDAYPEFEARLETEAA